MTPTQAQIEALRKAAISCTEAANALTAAAEVEPPDGDIYFSTEHARWFLEQIAKAKAATIERCAQVADEYEKYAENFPEEVGGAADAAEAIAARIRELKDRL